MNGTTEPTQIKLSGTGYGPLEAYPDTSRAFAVRDAITQLDTAVDAARASGLMVELEWNGFLLAGAKIWRSL